MSTKHPLQDFFSDEKLLEFINDWKDGKTFYVARKVSEKSGLMIKDAAEAFKKFLDWMGEN